MQQLYNLNCLANLENLKSLWLKYGALPLIDLGGSTLYLNTNWPHRCWLHHQSRSLEKLAEALPSLPAKSVLPLWPAIADDHGAIEQLLLEKDWECCLQQTAMSLNLAAYTLDKVTVQQTHSIVQLNQHTDVQPWVDVASAAFDYAIESRVIAPLLRDDYFRLLLVLAGEIPVACALLFKTGTTVGIHQVGVHPGYQGQGIAGSLMRYLINLSAEWHATRLVLQASEAGKPLYKRLGFEDLFVIKSYHRKSST